jgi:acyl-CoA dehydrogenase-like protein
MAAQRRPFEHAEGSMSKLKASEVAVRACEQAIQTLGGWGYIRDFPVEKWYRDAKLYTIFEGTREIQRLVIGRALRAAANNQAAGRADGRAPVSAAAPPTARSCGAPPRRPAPRARR